MFPMLFWLNSNINLVYVCVLCAELCGLNAQSLGIYKYICRALLANDFRMNASFFFVFIESFMVFVCFGCHGWSHCQAKASKSEKWSDSRKKYPIKITSNLMRTSTMYRFRKYFSLWWGHYQTPYTIIWRVRKTLSLILPQWKWPRHRSAISCTKILLILLLLLYIITLMSVVVVVSLAIEKLFRQPQKRWRWRNKSIYFCFSFSPCSCAHSFIYRKVANYKWQKIWHQMNRTITHRRIKKSDSRPQICTWFTRNAIDSPHFACRQMEYSHTGGRDQRRKLSVLAILF